MTNPGAIPPPGAEPLDPTVLDLLRGSVLAPMLDQPVNDILHNLGLPNLPEMPAHIQMPEMPPLPPLDLTALMRPLTDLASAFGSGQLPAAAPAPAPANADGTQNAAAPAPAPDPTQLLSGISTVMQTVMQVGTSAIQTAMSVWQGLAAMEAAKKAGEAQADAGKLQAQSGEEKLVLGEAAGSVFTGAGLMSAVVAKFSTTLALAPLYAATPAGQVFLAASAVEAMAEALGITVKTKGELLGHSGTMTKAGTKVPITNAPKGVAGAGGADQLSQLMSLVTPLISTASTAAQSLGQLAQASSSLSAPKSPIDSKAHVASELSDEEKAKAEASRGAGPGVGAYGPGPGAAAAPAQPLNPWQGTRVASGSVGALTGLGSVGASPAAAAAMSGSTGTGSGMMPMGGAGAMGAAGMARDGESSTDALRGQMVTSQHGDEVVGRIEGVSLPVVGAADTTSEPPPDKELTL
ncbi:hypothetical protein [Nocardia brasiliensis]|uniref:Uncharacterized protein n=1 Tax=Nocardia brasiliensis (strain ATCC 700358 / HUJEG-1) TaxID=1133849 RepID=K0EHX5_NOCB7|nr:hypothetical protein [Nocardia brasiliensis]AFT98892.1 hypothetical protein O3I_004650 [Nocardia brasiliensis ATCC 700358]OCF87078.1 hypothetical protein AW168_26845 [Nocardia brasiliensis]